MILGVISSTSFVLLKQLKIIITQTASEHHLFVSNQLALKCTHVHAKDLSVVGQNNVSIIANVLTSTLREGSVVAGSSIRKSLVQNNTTDDLYPRNLR